MMGKELFTNDAQLFHNDALRLPSVWYPCKGKPSIEGDTLRCVLDYGRPFTVFEAYGSQAHREFINAGTDGALIEFVRKWGPLWSEEAVPLSLLREWRDELTAWTRIIGSPGSHDAAKAVCYLLHSESDHPILTPAMRAFLDGRELWHQSELGPLDPELEHRILQAPRQQGTRICGFILQHFGPSMNSFGIAIDRNRPRAVYRFHDLSDGFRWMLWQDLFKEKPFRFCHRKECGKIVIQEEGRFRKFCTAACEKLNRDRKYAKALRRKRRKDGLTSRGTVPKRSSALKTKPAGGSE